MRRALSIALSFVFVLSSVEPGVAQVASLRSGAAAPEAPAGYGSLSAEFDGTPSLPSLQLEAAEAPLSSLESLSSLPSVPVSLSLRGLPAAPEARPAVSRWEKLVTGLKLAVVAIPIGLCLPFGRIEVFLRSRSLLRKYPGAKLMGGGHSNVVLRAGERIIKRYGVTGTLLALLSRVTLPTPNPGGMGRRHRFEADKAAFQDFEAAGIPASRLLESDPKSLTNVNSFVNGQQLSQHVREDAAMSEAARSLRLAHDRGWAIIDNQPSNFVIGADKRAYFIDLEHAYRDADGRYRAWDVGVFLTWLDAGLDEPSAKKAEAAFWAGYGEVSPELAKDIAVVREQMETFRPFMKISFDDSASASVPPPAP